MQPFTYGYRYFLFTTLALGFIWLRSSWGKIAEGKFVDSLGGVLTKFASNNPNTWYKDLLQTVAIPNAKTMGPVIMWLEFATAILLAGSVIYLLTNKKKNTTVAWLLALGFLFGMVLNANFWLAAGWMSASTDGLNLLMLLFELIGFVSVFSWIQKEA